MIVSIGEEDLHALLETQLGSNFLCRQREISELLPAIPTALLRTEKCLGASHNKYYWNDAGELLFNPFHSGQYCTFLYYLSNTVAKSGNTALADKIYYLNKMLNSCELFHQIELPDIFCLDHPYSTGIGRAKFSNYFVFQQNCTVGNNKGVYPSFGEFVWLFANSTVLGDSRIGNNVFIAANTLIKDAQIPDNTIVFGRSPELVLKSKPTEYFHAKSPFKIHRKTG